MSAKLSNAEYLRKLRAEARARGYCGECRARPAKQGRATCEACLAKHSERSAAYVAVGLCKCGREPDRGLVSCVVCSDVHAQRAARIREKKIDRGECQRCERPAAPGRRHCMVHLADNSRQSSKRRASFVDLGICGYCHGAPLASESLCSGCLQRMRDYERRRRTIGVSRRNYKHGEGA